MESLTQLTYRDVEAGTAPILGPWVGAILTPPPQGGGDSVPSPGGTDGVGGSPFDLLPTDKTARSSLNFPQGPPGGETSSGPVLSPQEKKRRRLYQRIKSGLSWHHGERLKFITLTSPEMPNRALGDAWRALHERIRRSTRLKMHFRGAPLHVYRDRPLLGLIDFDYIKVETREGLGVLHILYFGDYIPVRWLQEVWNEVRGAWNVNIQQTRAQVGNTRRLASYILGQYITGQDALVRQSWGRGWVFQGFVGTWRALIKAAGFPVALLTWEWMMSEHHKEPDLIQSTLNTYIPT